jgi:hypothetical protein
MRYKKIEGYKNYVVFENGQILNTKTNRFLSPVLNVNYYTVLLYDNNKRKKYYVHRIVANAFCEKKEGKNQVNHIDLNKTNNHFSNLEWVDSKENVNHYVSSSFYNKRKLTKEQIDLIKKRNFKKVICLVSGNIFNSIGDFAKYKNISISQASQKLNGIYKNNLNAKLYRISEKIS